MTYNSPYYFLGIDPSLTNTGAVLLNDFGEITGIFSSNDYLIPKKIYKKKSATARIFYICDSLRKFLSEQTKGDIPSIHSCIIEGYSFGSNGNLTQLGELGGVIRQLLYYLDIPFFSIPPTTIKRFAVGKGNALKIPIYNQALKEIAPSSFTFKNTDESDAYFMSLLSYYLAAASGILKEKNISFKEKLEKLRVDIVNELYSKIHINKKDDIIDAIMFYQKQKILSGKAIKNFYNRLCI